MMRLLRLIKILSVALHYGLDEIILTHDRLRSVRALSLRLLFWRDLSLPRGQRLRLTLEALGPIFVKFGQVLSTRRDLLPVDELVAIDRWAVERARALQEELLAAYRDYQFHLIYQKLHNFCSEFLGAFYLDILKDRLYTLGTNSPLRRSSQTAIHHIFNARLRLLAPIITFTTDEDQLINNVSIGGLPASYTRLNIDGMSATGVSGNGRAATLHSFSASGYEQLEVISAQTPDKAANAIGGQINLKTRSPLAQRKSAG